jgi:hypothetical protein
MNRREKIHGLRRDTTEPQRLQPLPPPRNPRPSPRVAMIVGWVLIALGLAMFWTLTLILTLILR